MRKTETPRDEGSYEYYREKFFTLLLSLNPRSVLDVGCGDGALIAKLQRRKIPAKGVDPAAQQSDSKMADPSSIVQASAEKLPFDNGAFDIVVSEFSAHHFCNPGLAIKETVRVARRAVVVLDVWYDVSLLSQRHADSLDRWRKSADQYAGDIHWPTHNAADLTAMFLAADPKVQLEFHTFLKLETLDNDDVRKSAEAHAKNRAAPKHLQTALGQILTAAQKDGFSADGAILAIARVE